MSIKSVAKFGAVTEVGAMIAATSAQSWAVIIAALAVSAGGLLLKSHQRRVVHVTAP